MMRAGQWVPIGPFEVCADHDEDTVVVIYDEQTRELHVPAEIGPFRVRVRAGQCGAVSPLVTLMCELAAGHAGHHSAKTVLPGHSTTWGERTGLGIGPCRDITFVETGLGRWPVQCTRREGHVEWHGDGGGREWPYRCLSFREVTGALYRCERESGHEGGHAGRSSLDGPHAEWDETGPAEVCSISAHYEDLGRQGMEALADTMASLDAGPRCDIAPPPGFARCTRALGHDGPCAMPEDNAHLFAGGPNGEAYTCPHGVKMGAAYPLRKCRQCHPTSRLEQG